MNAPTSNAARATDHTAAFYREQIEAKKLFIASIEKSDSKDNLPSASEECLSLGLALYATGARPTECLHWFGEAVRLAMRALELSDYRFLSYSSFGSDLELFSAAALVGQAPALIAANRRCSFDEPIPDVEGPLIAQLCGVLLDKPTLPPTAAEMRKAPKNMAMMPAMLQAVATHNTATFAATLAPFLSLYWKPLSKSWDPDTWVPRWSLLGTTLCARMGGVPALPASLRQYIAVDLIDAANA
jgi:hypothetical protein